MWTQVPLCQLGLVLLVTAGLYFFRSEALRMTNRLEDVVPTGLALSQSVERSPTCGLSEASIQGLPERDLGVFEAVPVRHDVTGVAEVPHVVGAGEAGE